MSTEKPRSRPASAPAGQPAERQRILSEVEAGACRFVDIQFTDVTGAVKSVVLPAGQLREALEHGHWFDGSALEGAGRMMERDLLLRPDLSTWSLLPWPGAHGERTGRVLCDIQTPEGRPYPADPRAVLTRALTAAADLGYSYHIASELEFFLFPDAGRGPGARDAPSVQQLVAAGPADRGGYFDLESQQGGQVRDEMAQAIEALGVRVEASHHEIGPGQQEIDLQLSPASEAADAIITCKYVIKSVARRRRLLATFMPKPLATTAGSGLHLHQMLLNAAGKNALADPADEFGLSPTGRAFIAGQLAHARAMCAVLAPSVNSYKRLGRGFDAPSLLVWGQTNPLAVVRVPRPVSRRAVLPRLPLPPRSSPHATAEAMPGGTGAPLWVELRCPDPSCNPYLALAAALAAGLEGIQSGRELPPPVEGAAAAGHGVDEFQLEVLPASLGEAIDELQWNAVIREALGAPVFEHLLQAKEQEWQAYRRQVTPWELERYFEAS